MQILKKSYCFLLLLIILCLNVQQTSPYELSLINNATFALDASTYYFNNHLIYQNTSFFYLISIYDSTEDSIMQIDQSNHNTVSQIGNLPIDNFFYNTKFISFNLNDYLAFIYDVQSESGYIGTLLIVNKQNFSQNYKSSLYSSYIAAAYVIKKDSILAISIDNQVNTVIDPQNSNYSIIFGPYLNQNWADYSDATLIKSVNQNYFLIVSIQRQTFELIQLNTQSLPFGITIINHNFINVSSVCFIQQSQIVIHQSSTISFYTLPNLDLVSSSSINQTFSSYCYYDDITEGIVFVYSDQNQAVFFAFNIANATQDNTTIVDGYTQIYLSDSNLYLVHTVNSAAVSYSFFNYQSCHHSFDYNSNTLACSQCPSRCNTCNSTQYCYDCFSGSYFIDDYCCGNSQYYLVVNSLKNCFNCPRGCYNCTSSSYCMTCNPNNYFIDDYCCGNSQFYLVVNTTKSCNNCPKGCYNCSSLQLCFTCLANNYFIDDYCCGNSQYYYIKTNNTKACGNCPTGCSTCNSSTYCLTCKTKNYFIDDYCCGLSQYYVSANSTKSCRQCPSGCYNCSNSTNCYTCNANLTINNNYCCGFSQYALLANGSKTCRSCPSGCYNCSNSSYCYSCTGNLTFYNHFCCAQGQYAGMVNGSMTCVQCPSGCNNCSDSSSCFSCRTNFVMIRNFCCRANQYYSSQSGVVSCGNCGLGCDSCFSQSYCFTCNTSWMLGIDNRCYNSTQSMLAGQYAGDEGGAMQTIQALSQNNFINFFNSLPSIRGMIQPVFGSFIWFDQLYLYQFHERNYGYNMQLMFQSIQQIQKQKWAGLNWLITDRFLTLFNTSVQQLSSSLSYKQRYTSEHFLYQQKLGQGLLPNTLSFFASVILITLALFLILRLIFFIAFKHRWSRFFRSFSFWPYILIILMQGNLLQLVFFACGDLRMGFALMFSQKLANVFSLYFLFFLAIFSISIFSLLVSSYKKNVLYFCSNLKFNDKIVIYLTIEFGIRGLFQAMIHYFLKEEQYYQIQLITLIIAEACFCINYIYFINQSVFNYKLKVWLSILLSISKMLIIFFLYIRMDYSDVTSLLFKTNTILGYVSACYMTLIYINLGASILIFIRQLIMNILKTIKKDEDERLNQLNQIKKQTQDRLKQENIKYATEEYKSVVIHPLSPQKQPRSMFFSGDNKPVGKTSSQLKKIVRIKR